MTEHNAIVTPRAVACHTQRAWTTYAWLAMMPDDTALVPAAL